MSKTFPGKLLRENTFDYHQIKPVNCEKHLNVWFAPIVSKSSLPVQKYSGLIYTYLLTSSVRKQRGSSELKLVLFRSNSWWIWRRWSFCLYSFKFFCLDRQYPGCTGIYWTLSFYFYLFHQNAEYGTIEEVYFYEIALFLLQTFANVHKKHDLNYICQPKLKIYSSCKCWVAYNRSSRFNELVCNTFFFWLLCENPRFCKKIQQWIWIS